MKIHFVPKSMMQILRRLKFQLLTGSRFSGKKKGNRDFSRLPK